MASDVMVTSEVLYSWNEGLDWQRLAITHEPMYVDNVIIEPRCVFIYRYILNEFC